MIELPIDDKVLDEWLKTPLTEKNKLIKSLECITELTNLLEGNEYQQFLYGHLINIQVELKRQLCKHVTVEELAQDP